MTFVDRTYPDIVRDVLTNLTQGVTREVHRVSYNALGRPLQVPDVVLLRRPVRRVSLVQGVIDGRAAGDPPVPYTFTLNDYELVGDDAAPKELSRIRFLPFGRKPAPESEVVVNYYPRTTEPTPLTDLNVGSVTRTVVEALSRELALLYAQLNLVYDSAFLDSASDSSLERVVALLGYQRFRAGRAIGTVTFARRPGSVGSITIPAGTPITDSSDKIRYETTEARSLLAGESSAQVAVRASTANTPVVDSGALTVIQRSIAGLDRVINERPTTRATDDETDEQLRARARDALRASNKGTLQAIEFGLLQLPDVRSVKIVEMPNGVPGELALTIDLTQPLANGALPRAVLERIEELRPAGIRIINSSATSVALQANVHLTLAGSSQPAATIEQIHRQARSALVAEVKKKGVGEKLRNRALTAVLLRDERIVDAVLTLSVAGGDAGTAGADFAPDAKSGVQLQETDVAFEADAFDNPLSDQDRIPVEVRATLTATPVAGAPLSQVKSEIQARLSTFFLNLSSGNVTSSTLLTALSNDALYAIDPLKLQVTLSTVDQFFVVAEGGQSFTVQPQQIFNLVTVELNP
ncbi:MAG TPA: baseplate J/gp47 family protein [Polyangiaceae bacterium]|nr:baseplate J/gp47 family protein [Polyangiaceae bacterium]